MRLANQLVTEEPTFRDSEFKFTPHSSRIVNLPFGKVRLRLF